MKKQIEKGASVNNSNTGASVDVLPVVEIEDVTTTKGKVSQKCNIQEQNKTEEEAEKVDKNQLFSTELSIFFCPVSFDGTQLENSLTPLVESGILSEDAKQAAINKAQREFLEAHAEEIEKAQKLDFSQVVAKLQTNETLYKKVLQACKVSELKESEYIEDGKVKIYRAAQCQDKDGKDKYKDVTLSHEENGQKFSVSLFVEYREVTTNNILLAIRYNQSKQDAKKRLYNKIQDYRRILTAVYDAGVKAASNGFSLESAIAEVEKAFHNVANKVA